MWVILLDKSRLHGEISENLNILVNDKHLKEYIRAFFWETVQNKNIYPSGL